MRAWRNWPQHITSTVRGRDINACLLTCSLVCAQLRPPTPPWFRISCLGNGATHSGLGLPKPTNLIKIISYRHAHGPIKCRLSLQVTQGVTRWQLKLAITGAHDLVVGRMKRTWESFCNYKVQYKWCLSLKRGSKGYSKAQVYKGDLAWEPGLSIRFLLQGQNSHVKYLWRTRSLNYAHVVITSVSKSCLHSLREAELVDVLLFPSGTILNSRKESAIFTCAYITLSYCYFANFFFFVQLINPNQAK